MIREDFDSIVFHKIKEAFKNTIRKVVLCAISHYLKQKDAFKNKNVEINKDYSILNRFLKNPNRMNFDDYDNIMFHELNSAFKNTIRKVGLCVIST